MTLDEQLKYCKICQNRKMNMQIGLVCGLTNAKPSFEGTCPTFALDKPEADRLIALEKEAQAEENTQGGFSPEQKGIKKGMLGGIVMMAISVVWFFGGLAIDRIFFYPPILFCIGVYALIKGMRDGNLSGKK